MKHTPLVMNIIAEEYVFFRLRARLNYERDSFIFSVLASNEEKFSLRRFVFSVISILFLSKLFVFMKADPFQINSLS